jgi:HEAT repeats
MTESTPCGYCVELPEHGRGTASRITRCPLCKTELGVTPAGQRFRVSMSGASPRRRPWATLVTLTGIATAVSAWMLLRPAPVPAPDRVDLPPPPAPIVQQAPRDLLPAPPTAPADVALRKVYAVGVLSPEARAKPPMVESRPAVDPTAAGVAEASRVSTDAVRIAVAVPIFICRAQESNPLQHVPELTLDESLLSTKVSREQARRHISELVDRIRAANEKATDGHIQSLIAERRDLAGLPFLLGEKCRMASADAVALREASLEIRTALGKLATTADVRARMAGTPSVGAGPMQPADKLWALVGSRRGNSLMHMPTRSQLESLLTGATQILATEDAAIRGSLVEQYRLIPGTKITQMLVRLAIFDLDPEIRAQAVSALQERPKPEYTEVLLEGLRYPWAAVADNAADALVELGRNDLLPRLQETLDTLDAAKAKQVGNDKGVIAVRELVRINHHRNCLLCHEPAPKLSSRELRTMVVGPVPSPAEPLPPMSSTVYYQPEDGRSLVRGDVTYLRQDFSVMLPVDNADPWPRMQRFDFLVRTRTVQPDRSTLDQQEQVAAAQQRAILSARQRLMAQ